MAYKNKNTIHQIIKQAQYNLNQPDWDYLIGGTETETTLARNRQALDSLGFRPSVLNDVSEIDPSGSFLGQHLTIPVLLAPIGSLQKFEAGGGATAARAAGEYGIMSIASSVCTPGIEEIAAASDAPKVFQLYVRGDEKWVDDIVERVIASGYKAFCLTVDTAVVSRRERDLAKGHLLTSRSNPGDMIWQARLNWKDVERIRKTHDIPLILKGINTPADASRALDLGVDVIYVSNHGGRQLDHGPGAIDLLPEIVALAKGRAEIVIDGGFYRGADILKGLALGADAVGIGRLEAWAMAAGGVDGLLNMLDLLEWEIRTNMALLGITSLSELNESFLTRTTPVREPSVFSAFPLLNLADEGYC
ncbi:MAG: alpha-hydroxy-acid oxidizing protein [Pseudomonadales bacterium]|nr:alpha-hydroxy-acid oxidizing protein [Pseudomonadales bacterium]